VTAEEIRQILLSGFPDAAITVSGEDSNFSVDIVSPEFENVSRLNRQKNVLSCVKDLITAGEIHAFSVQAFTREEWDQTSNTLTIL